MRHRGVNAGRIRRHQLPDKLARASRKPSLARSRRAGSAGANSGHWLRREREQLDVEPARYFVLVTKREKRACRCLAVQAWWPCRLWLRHGSWRRDWASDRVVVEMSGGQVLRSSAAVPAGRDPGAWDAGVEIGRATLDGWVMRVGELLETGGGSDATGSRCALRIWKPTRQSFRCRCTTSAERDHQAYLWQYGKPGGETIFEFRMGRGDARVHRKFLG